jgi:hypothetical protein
MLFNLAVHVLWLGRVRQRLRNSERFDVNSLRRATVCQSEPDKDYGKCVVTLLLDCPRSTEPRYYQLSSD